MADIMDYLDWRGDVPFSVSPVNEVDEFILCKIGTPDLSGMVPEDGAYVTVGQAVEAYKAAGGDLKLGIVASEFTVPVFFRLPETERFRDLQLSGYRLKISETRTEQFSALTVRLPDGRHYVTFRGTDDTLVGWKENFQLTVMDAVPAQADALKYLLWAAETYPGELVVGGHSKGANLSVYAASMAPEEIQDRITLVCNYDGPGFMEDFLDNPGYRRILPKIRTLMPENATVGTLLFQEDEYEVVRSIASNRLLAHDGFTWETTPTGFVRAEELSPSARAIDRGMNDLLRSMNRAQRAEFIDTFFNTLGASGAETLTDVTEQRMLQTLKMVRELNQEPEVRRMVVEMIENIVRDYAQERGVPLFGWRRLRKRKEENSEKTEEL
ncbi:MAG: DUF2974 domain-containing protein [Oscillospiraceae bacterium]|nr:DUF2974 domain-containing protein [Oscillospiraceae bacterium]